MAFRPLEKALYSVHKEIDHLNFSDILSKSRESLGINRKKCAEFVGLDLHRLKTLEDGFFTQPPMEGELEALSYFYLVDYDILQEKAEEQAAQWNKKKKIKVIPQPHIEEYEELL